MRLPAASVRRRFQQRLLAWYAAHGRDLPWRRTRDPYRVLVSEIMLQQTQVERVLPKYREFLRRYPTFARLAAAPTPEVRRVWYPLGYNIRPVNLQGIARETMARYGGRLPDDRGELRKMRGIGPYTTGAILSFAYGQDAAVVDTNVRRVLGRVFLGRRGLEQTRGDRAFWRLAEALLPPGRAYDYNQALMDFGATWCTPRSPRCEPCVMKGFCRSYDSGNARTNGRASRETQVLAPRDQQRTGRTRRQVRVPAPCDEQTNGRAPRQVQVPAPSDQLTKGRVGRQARVSESRDEHTKGRAGRQARVPAPW